MLPRSPIEINPLTPKDHYIGRTAPLNSKRCILYIYSTNTGTEYFKYVYALRFFYLSSKCSLFHNSNIFGSRFIHILYTEYAKIKKNNSDAKRLKPGVFPGGKACRCVRLTTLPPSCAVVMKSGNLNFLEASGPLQACNGTAVTRTVVRCLGRARGATAT